MHSTPLSVPSYLGVVGPTIRLAVGDVCKVVFRNKLTMPANIVPLGLQYNSTEIVMPGATVCCVCVSVSECVCVCVCVCVCKLLTVALLSLKGDVCVVSNTQ